MNKKTGFLIAIIMFLLSVNIFAQEIKSIKLPLPDTRGGKPLMQALKERKSSREFSNKLLSPQVISDLLWAAAGVNRVESKGRTAPSAMNVQEIDIYVATHSGLYLYDPFKNSLELIVAEDIREVTGTQSFVKEAPINLIFVADFLRTEELEGNKESIAACDTGFISQNVYLYCASSGLSTVVRGWFDKKELSRAMKLKPGQKIILTQTVGYPK
ncbi:MAG: SagB/ThcOx family dehydrogenase [Candidatus Omnitrophica bacterium]|jgi:SagB-type dehydrogenase family enzyme|nr:SagB/ThcOx family dehydrogenase [Candidatus Omnitrophota bacterium]